MTTPKSTLEPRFRKRLVLCSKSRWNPPIRREHALSLQAAARGHDVTFIELADDVRGVRERPLQYVRGFAGAVDPQNLKNVRVLRRSSLVPGHRGRAWSLIDSTLLQRILEREVGPAVDTAIVCFRPWDWAALASFGGARRVFDMTDDWGALVPGRERRFNRIYRRIAEEADEIILVNPELEHHFPGRTPRVVPNGVSDAMLTTSPGPRPAATLVYVGTLSERFDAPLMAEVLRLLPNWRLKLVGPCAYAGHLDRPSEELQALLDLPQVSWHGPLPREAMMNVLDDASVGTIPNRAELSRGQDSMKAYDYTARALPVVSTVQLAAADGAGIVTVPPRATAFAEAVVNAAAEPPSRAVQRRQWAEQNSWAERWPAWSQAALGVSAK